MKLEHNAQYNNSCLSGFFISLLNSSRIILDFESIGQVIMFSDLECDYINPIDLCNKLNQVCVMFSPFIFFIFGSNRGRLIREGHFWSKWISLIWRRTWSPSLLIRTKQRITFMRASLSSIKLLTYRLETMRNVSSHWLTDSAWLFFSLQFVLPEMGAQAFLFAMFLINGSWLAALLNLPLVVFNVQK